jgi:hypothetical protein
MNAELSPLAREPGPVRWLLAPELTASPRRVAVRVARPEWAPAGFAGPALPERQAHVACDARGRGSDATARRARDRARVPARPWGRTACARALVRSGPRFGCGPVRFGSLDVAVTPFGQGLRPHCIAPRRMVGAVLAAARRSVGDNELLPMQAGPGGRGPGFTPGAAVRRGARQSHPTTGRAEGGGKGRRGRGVSNLWGAPSGHRAPSHTQIFFPL